MSKYNIKISPSNDKNVVDGILSNKDQVNINALIYLDHEDIIMYGNYTSVYEKSGGIVLVDEPQMINLYNEDRVLKGKYILSKNKMIWEKK